MATIEFKYITLVDRWPRANAMRLIRNSVRQYMTHSSEEIGFFRQLKWYLAAYKPALQHGTMYGFLYNVNGLALGYGLVTLRDGKYWVSGGLDEGARGRGYGEELFSFLTDFVQQHVKFDVYLDVFDDNLPAKKLYRKLGYRKVSSANGVTVMVNRRKGVK